MTSPPEPHRPSPLAVVREVLRSHPGASYEAVEAVWRERYGTTDLARLRREYDEEVTEIALGRQRTTSDRTIVLIAAAWIVAHVLLWAALGLPSYFECRSASGSRPGPYLGCGTELGLGALSIGAIQLVYGTITGAVVSIWNQRIVKGIGIGVGLVALLFTVLCFGVSNG